MTATDPTAAMQDVQRRVTSFAGEMREKGIHVGINGRCVCGAPWPCNGSDATTERSEQ